MTETANTMTTKQKDLTRAEATKLAQQKWGPFASAGVWHEGSSDGTDLCEVFVDQERSPESWTGRSFREACERAGLLTEAGR